jgi:hypothetical protein
MTEEVVQICTKCNESKQMSEFSVYVDKRYSKTRVRKQCKTCRDRDIEYPAPEKNLRGNIRQLSPEKYYEALEMLNSDISIYALSKFIGCSFVTAKKYLDNKSFV